MATHQNQGSDKGAVRREIERMRAELRAVTEAVTGREPPNFSVAELSDGNPVLRPVMPRRRAVRQALGVTRHPAVVLPLAVAWLTARWLALHVKLPAASKAALSAVAGVTAATLAAGMVPASLAVYATPARPSVSRHHASRPPTAPPAVLRHRVRRHRASPARARRTPAAPAGRSAGTIVPVQVPGAPGAGLPSVSPPPQPVPAPVPLPSASVPPAPVPSPVPSLAGYPGHVLHHVTGAVPPLPGAL